MGSGFQIRVIISPFEGPCLKPRKALDGYPSDPNMPNYVKYTDPIWKQNSEFITAPHLIDNNKIGKAW